MTQQITFGYSATHLVIRGVLALIVVWLGSGGPERYSHIAWWGIIGGGAIFVFTADGVKFFGTQITEEELWIKGPLGGRRIARSDLRDMRPPKTFELHVSVGFASGKRVSLPGTGPNDYPVIVKNPRLRRHGREIAVVPLPVGLVVEPGGITSS